MLRMPDWVDSEDLRQEAALAKLEGIKPSTAISRFIENERRYYGMIFCYLSDNIFPARTEYNVQIKIKTKRPPGGWPSDKKSRKRSPEAIARRNAYGRAYRAARKASNT